MKYATDIGSGARTYTYIPNFIKIDSGIEKLISGIHRHRQHGDAISLII
jgi:hypothetical protein